MKKLLLLIGFTLVVATLFSFVRNNESLDELKLVVKNKKELSAACCTVGDGHYEATYCDLNGSYRRTCRKARRALRQR